jgi:hypothetical protein
MIFGAGAFILAAMVQLAIDNSSKPINVAYQVGSLSHFVFETGTLFL